MKFLVNDPAASSHPLDIAGANLSATAAGVAMFQFALIRDGDGLKTFVRVCANAAPLVAWGKFVRRRIVEQQERTQFASEGVVIKHRADGKSVADPMCF